MKISKETKQWEYQWGASFYFQITTDLTTINEEGEFQERSYVAGHHYGIDTLVAYPGSQFCDALFTSGHYVPQVELARLGYYIGKPEIIEEKEAKEHPIISKFLEAYTVSPKQSQQFSQE